MEIKKVTILDGEYQCNVDVSVDEWKEILQDKNFERYLDALIKFYSEPNHESTCKALGKKHNISPQSFNGTITNFAKAVQKKLNRFEIIGVDEKPTYWIIPMIGKHVGKFFEWTIRPELVEALEELNIKDKHLLQKIYDEAIKNKHWVFSEWFPFYKECVQEYQKEAITNNWSDSVFERLIKNTTNNGIANLSQGNFTWDEFEKINKSWADIQPLIKKIAKENNINKQEYQKIYNFLNKQTSKNRQAGSNRVIAAFLPNIVTTVVTYGHLKNVITKLKEILPDYPQVQKNWLSDNINFIKYCNSNIEFKDSWHSSVFAWYLKEYFDHEKHLTQQKEATMQKYTDLLLNNKNLILTGAPGTGKTYLAKEIAKAMNAEIEFVQFHPSYDYTDFVEGLRPIKKDGSELGFELKDGVFKNFCRKAINQDETDNFDELYTEFIEELSESNVELETPTRKKKFKVKINSNKTCVAIPDTDIGTQMSITKEMIKDYILFEEIRDWKPYTVPIAKYFMKNYKVKTKMVVQDEKPHVIIIDEINRAEISKVFGELFFSMDSGYRGIKGRVKTQYSNLQDDGDIFKDGFYIPENIYIIGTMNDIDRSVESFDFAMRRRFAWKEIKAIDRISMWSGVIDDWKEESLKRMISINSKIETIQGLGSAFHIGPAYFLKLKNYNGNFEQLWNNHLEGVLFEYLRGLPQNKILLNELKNAFNIIGESQENVENN